MNSIHSFKNKFPLPIRLFLGKALLFFVVWRIVYSVFLVDSKWVDQKLTHHVGEASTFLLNNMGFMEGFTTNRKNVISVYEGETLSNRSSIIYHHNKRVLFIGDACNGLQLMVLYLGFIICMPSKFWRKFRYVVLGLLVLDFINILRCMGLVYLREYFLLYFDFAHHFLFKAMVYTAMFLIWKRYASKIKLKNGAIQN